MTNHGVEAFVDAILADRPPKQFSATPDDADLLRLAIELTPPNLRHPARPPVRPGARPPTGGGRRQGRWRPPPSHWARSVSAQGDRMRRAVLVASAGVTVAIATFS